jgi:hypothetical protein
VAFADGDSGSCESAKSAIRLNISAIEPPIVGD